MKKEEFKCPIGLDHVERIFNVNGIIDEQKTVMKQSSRELLQCSNRLFLMWRKKQVLTRFVLIEFLSATMFSTEFTQSTFFYTAN